jgi:hypothetical protein
MQRPSMTQSASTRMIDGKLYRVTNLDTGRARSTGTRRRHSSGGKRRGGTTARLFA